MQARVRVAQLEGVEAVDMPRFNSSEKSKTVASMALLGEILLPGTKCKEEVGGE